MKINVIYDKCIGCGKCYAICPEIFTLDDAGMAEVKRNTQPLTQAVLTKVQQAKKICPTGAIETQKPRN